MTPEERDRGRLRIMRWPIEARQDLVKLQPEEAALIVEAAALLDVRPSKPPTRAITIDLRRQP